MNRRQHCVAGRVLGLELGIALVFVGGCGARKEPPPEWAPTPAGRIDDPVDRSVRFPSSTASRSLESSRRTPPGVDPGIWHDIHWIPPTVAGVTRHRTGEDAPMVGWLKEQVAKEPEDCKRALAAVRSMITLEWTGQSSQTQIFFGTMDRGDVENCARRYLREPGETVTSEGIYTVFHISDADGDEGYLVPWKRDSRQK